jgi:hypothetical protein
MWCATFNPRRKNQPPKISNPLQKKEKPTTDGNYTLEQKIAVVKIEKKMANFIEIGGLNVGKEIWKKMGQYEAL